MPTRKQEPDSGAALRDTAKANLKFQDLSDDLRRDILAGTWAVGTKLPTEQQLAAETGLSLTTVRRAFEDLVGKGLVVRRQGAGSFVAAPQRAQKRSRFVIGVLLPDTQLYYPRVLQGIEEHLSARGASLQLSTYHYDFTRENASIQFLLDAGVDGLILVPTLTGLANPQQRASELMALPVPVVLLERSLDDLGPGDLTEHVCSDHQGGAYDAVMHLHRLGHRKIGLLTRANEAARSSNPTQAAVVAGYRAAVAALGLDTDGHRSMAFSATKPEWEADQAEHMFGLLAGSGATAALVFGDREAALLEGAASRHGVRVPEDLALVSYDDEMADLARIPLTAVSPAKHRLGVMAADVLLRRLTEGDACPLYQIRLRPRIVVRDSCGAKKTGIPQVSHAL
ncbi:UNVERIFIED_ORG: DNA-binding LacI/PurR family transcriptional regulator [Paenarthrobacter nicotinovorans]|uniref:GntR family transcriptional regulator n=1 Tax=Paenarthrobacter histidinolovorans TaxID=43664 RepID=UPI00166D81BB|nr:substrate-binding domain-containing protein [Paenarthrobacter histidinolovorans]GGJ37014.1 LacI family transcriptional regulator [Paenarthrobacter histidinolovorans]